MEKMTTLRIDSELLKKAKKAAKDTGRSLSGLIRYLLKKFIEDK